RYGGVIVFFDEADALGNRGQLGPPGSWGGPSMTPTPWAVAPACNGMGYMQEHTRWMLMRDSLQSGPPAGPPAPNRVIAGLGGFGGGGGMGTVTEMLSEIRGMST